MTSLASRVLDPGPQRRGRVAGEHHGMHDTEPRARQHRHDGLGDHRHVDGDPVTGDHTEVGERVGGLATPRPAGRSRSGCGCRRPARPPSGWPPGRRCPASTWRSTQLYATLSLPPTNHLANGASDQSSTSVNGVSQDSRLACFAQNASRSSSRLAVQLRGRIGVRGELRRRRIRRTGLRCASRSYCEPSHRTLHQRWQIHTCTAGGSRRAPGVVHDRPSGRGGRLASDARRGGGRQPDSRGPGCSRSRRRSPAAGAGHGQGIPSVAGGVELRPGDRQEHVGNCRRSGPDGWTAGTLRPAGWIGA